MTAVCQDVVGVVLAAGAGTRLRPLTLERPKALCPVGDVPLLDLAVGRVTPCVAEVAVNVHHGRAAMEEHLAALPGVHPSIEAAEALGTAGAVAFLRRWIDGRGVLVVNADAWCTASFADLLAGWDRERVRLLLHESDDLGPRSRIVGSVLPWSEVVALEAVPSGLYERCWGAAQVAGRVDCVRFDGDFVDCGTPAQYLDANLRAGGGVSARATVEGEVVDSVVWDGATVSAGEHLQRAIRTPARTVLVR